MTENYPFFVYGTLRPDLYPGYHWIEGIGGVSKGSAWLHGYELWERAVPYVVRSGDRKSRVRGCLIQFPEANFERVVWTLDKYESYSPAFPQASLYIRQLVKVRLGEEIVKAWCYVANQATHAIDESYGYMRVPSGDYADYNASWRSLNA